MTKSSFRQHRGLIAVQKYVLAVLNVAVATFLTMLLIPNVFNTPLLFGAILISSWFGGRCPGLVATVLAIFCLDYFIIPPHFTLSWDKSHASNLIVFAVFSLFFSWASANRKNTQELLRESQENLEEEVRKRTAELQTANENLQTQIAEREKTEMSLLEQANLLDLTHDSIFVRDMSDVITYWNRAAEELYGWSALEAGGKITHQLLETVFTAPLNEIDGELLRTGRWEGELVHTKRDGTQIYVASRWALQSDAQGNPIAVLETNNDITGSRQAAQELHRQANLLEQAHDAIFVWEFPRTIVYWNRGAEQLYGFAREEVIGRLSHELLHTEHPMGTPDFEAGLKRDGEWTGELIHTTRDGRRIIVESRHVLMHESGGRQLVLETNRDITDRKRAEEALHQAQADLAHVSRVTTMGELTASLAHEVNQPITAAVTNANTCLRWLDRDEPDLEEARAAAARIVKDGTRAAEIISRIRLLFKKGIAERDSVDINEVIREMMVLLRSEATRYSISVRTDLAADLPHVRADRVQLQQVFMNLMLNGIEAMKDMNGGGELTIKSQQAENGQLLVTVRDTGVGLPPQQADRIFDAFFTTKPEGTGMGLSISRSIVESHDGRLWATPNEGEGATIQFTLPLNT